jgi:hypothetical protein
MAALRKAALGTTTFKKKPKVRRPGVHAKTKTSKNKTSKLYKKPYNRQGR